VVPGRYSDARKSLRRRPARRTLTLSAATMSSHVLIPSEFKPSELTFSTLEKNRLGGKQCFVSRAGTKSKILLQTPPLFLPWGITPYQDVNSGAVQSWSMDLSFKGADTDPAIAEFLAKMRALDEALVDVATERSPEWFGKTMNRDLVAEFTRKFVRDPTNPQYAPTMKVKVPCVNGMEQTKFYDEQRQPVPMEYCTKSSQVRVILELSPVWFLNKSVGLTWKALQVQVVSRPRVIQDFAFVDNGDETAAEVHEPEDVDETGM